MKPQLQQKGMDPMNPMTQRTKATSILGALFPQVVSQMTVEVASMAEKDESIPSMKRVVPRMKAHKFWNDI